jgi:hypothetical protein
MSNFSDRWLSQVSQLSQSRVGELKNGAEGPQSKEAVVDQCVNVDTTKDEVCNVFRIVRKSKAAKAAKAVSAPDLAKGVCHRCGELVTWSGQLEGLQNSLGEIVHLRCPPSPVTPSNEPVVPESDDEPPAEPPLLDDNGYQAMLRDFCLVRPDVARAWRRRELNDPLWHDPSASLCGVCGDDTSWRPERVQRWRCRTCERPNARRSDLVWRAP